MVEIKPFIHLKNSVFEHAIEKETLRVLPDGKLTLNAHPKVFGSALCHPDITLDFAEAQLELVTKPFSKLFQAIASLDEILTFLHYKLEDEFLWPSSAPCRLPAEEKIPIANFGTSEEGMKKNLYRLGLKSRYGARMQTFSGLHYNISFRPKFWKNLFAISKESIDFHTFVSEKYLHIMRNYFREAWLISYLFGSTPAVDKTYFHEDFKSLKKISKDTFVGEHATTLRMSQLGYYVKVASQKNISFNNYINFVRDFKRVVSTNSSKYAKYKNRQLNSFLFQTESEFYGRIRAKPKKVKYQSFIQGLKQGITYLEIRSLDLNPLYSNTLDVSAFEFLQLFLLYCLFKKSPKILANQTKYIYQTQNLVALYGRKKNLQLFNGSKKQLLVDWGRQILDEMHVIAHSMGKIELLEEQEQKLLNIEKTPSAQVLKEIFLHEKSFVNFGLFRAKKYKKAYQTKKLAENKLQEFEKKAERSLKKQALIEAG